MFKFGKKRAVNFAELHERTEKIISHFPVVKEKTKVRTAFRILKYILVIILIFFTTIFIYLGMNFFTLKNIYNKTMAGKSNLEKSVENAKKQNFRQAEFFSTNAKDDFDSSIKELEKMKSSVLAKYIPALETQINNAEYLLTTAEFLSRAVMGGANFGLELESILSSDKKLSYSKFTKEEKRLILQRIFESSPDLNGIKANLDIAIINLDQFRPTGVFWPIKGKIEDIKAQLNDGRYLLGQAIPITQILPQIAGYPGKMKYLIVLQNSDELRPTGGFIGTYGILELEYGDIVKLETHDIYHLDMPVKDKINITPPAPLKKYLNVDKWYMRDANWSPDWPTAANKIEWFYKTESGLTKEPGIEKVEKFDGVIAITPQLIMDILSLTGPITVNGEEYNQNNFQDLLQYKVERGYEQLGISKWQRKEVVGDIVKQLKIRLLDMPSSNWRDILNIFNDNIDKKNILVYLNDIQLEQIIKERGWAGEMKNTASDYLMVVDANMAAAKTDAVISRVMEYKIEQDKKGLVAKLNIYYSHHGGVDWKTTRYRSYTRIYVPQGSKLIKSRGLENITAGNELAKAYFGGFFTVEPGDISNVYVEYRLPDRLAKMSQENYSLFVQKQPGNNVGELKVDFNFANPVKSYSPTGFYVKLLNNDKEISWEGDFLTDKYFSISF